MDRLSRLASITLLAVYATACVSGRPAALEASAVDVPPEHIHCPSDQRDRNGWDRLTLRFIVRADGTADPASIRADRRPEDSELSPELLERAEVELMQCAFTPARMGDRPVAAFTTLRVYVEPAR